METLLEIKNLQKSFEEKHVHRGVSFNLYKGETIGLLGNSGTGKSVLLRSIIGLDEMIVAKFIIESRELMVWVKKHCFKLGPGFHIHFRVERSLTQFLFTRMWPTLFLNTPR